jgi:hypothetical protein
MHVSGIGFVLFIFSLLPAASSAQDKAELKGLKKMICVQTSYDQSGKDTGVSYRKKKIVGYMPDGQVSYHAEISQGDTSLIESTEYTAFGKPLKKTARVYYRNYFDEQYTMREYKTLTEIRERVFNYDKANNIILETYTAQRIEDSVLNPERTVYSYQTQYVYDKNDSILLTRQKASNEKKFRVIQRAQYGPFGKTKLFLVVANSYPVDSVRYNMAYDEKGRLVKKISDSFEKKKRTRDIEIFAYSEKGLTREIIKQSLPDYKRVEYLSERGLDSAKIYEKNKYIYTEKLKKTALDSIPKLSYFEGYFNGWASDHKVQFDVEGKVLKAYADYDGFPRTYIYEYSGKYIVRVKEYGRDLSAPVTVSDYSYEFY